MAAEFPATMPTTLPAVGKTLQIGEATWTCVRAGLYGVRDARNSPARDAIERNILAHATRALPQETAAGRVLVFDALRGTNGAEYAAQTVPFRDGDDVRFGVVVAIEADNPLNALYHESFRVNLREGRYNAEDFDACLAPTALAALERRYDVSTWYADRPHLHVEELFAHLAGEWGGGPAGSRAAPSPDATYRATLAADLALPDPMIAVMAQTVDGTIGASPGDAAVRRTSLSEMGIADTQDPRLADATAIASSIAALTDASLFAIVAARFGLPEPVVCDLIETDVAILRARDGYFAPSNTTEPTDDFEPLPIGAAKVGMYGDPENAYIDYLREFDPHQIMPSESEDGIQERDPSYKRYVQWFLEGRTAPPISVFDNKNYAQPVSANRRRVLAAREAGVKSIQGWYGPHNAETGRPLKFGDVTRAYAEALLAQQASAPENHNPLDAVSPSQILSPSLHSPDEDGRGADAAEQDDAVTPELSTPHHEARHHVMRLGRQTAHEHMVIFDRGGEDWFETTSGQANNVRFPVALYPRMDDPGEALTAHHNHCLEYGPARGDLVALVCPGLRRVITHTSSNYFSLQLTEHTRQWVSRQTPALAEMVLHDLWDKAAKSIIPKILEVDNQSGNTHTLMKQLAIDAVMRSLVAAGLVEYTSSVDPHALPGIWETGQEVRQAAIRSGFDGEWHPRRESLDRYALCVRPGRGLSELHREHEVRPGPRRIFLHLGDQIGGEQPRLHSTDEGGRDISNLARRSLGSDLGGALDSFDISATDAIAIAPDAPPPKASLRRTDEAEFHRHRLIPRGAVIPPPGHPAGTPWRNHQFVMHPLPDGLIGVTSTRSADRFRAEALLEEIDPTAAILMPTGRLVVFEAILDTTTGDIESVDGAIIPAPQLRRALGLDGEATDGVDFVTAVSMRASDPFEVLAHEAVHYVRQTGRLSDNEYETLAGCSDDWINQFDIIDRYPDEDLDSHREESIAEALGSYERARRRPEHAVGGRGRFPAGNQQTPAAADQLGFQIPPPVGEIFDRILSGEISRRQEPDASFSQQAVTPPVGGPEFSRDTASTPSAIFAQVDVTTPAFKEWFGDSMVVDKDGAPLIVYHGSVNRGVTSFDPDISPVRGRTGPNGTYFTSDPQSAYGYARHPGQRQTGEVVSAYLSLQNPLDITADIARMTRRGDSFGDAKRQALAKLQPNLHDGVVFRGDRYNAPEYVAFDPAQIKSATLNTGDFSRDNADIRFSRSLPFPQPASFRTIPLDVLTPPPGAAAVGTAWRAEALSLVMVHLAPGLVGVISRRSADQQRADDIVGLIRPHADAMTPHAAIEVYEALYRITDDGTAPEEVGGAFFGRKDSAGSYIDMVIAISSRSPDPIATFDHETLHYAKRTGSLTNAEYDTIKQSAPEWIEQFRIERDYPGLDRATHIEESVAFAFAAHAGTVRGDLRDGSRGRGSAPGADTTPAPQGVAVTLPPAVTDVFARILSGEVGARYPERGVGSETVMAAQDDVAFRRDRRDTQTLDLFAATAVPPAGSQNAISSATATAAAPPDDAPDRPGSVGPAPTSSGTTSGEVAAQPQAAPSPADDVRKSAAPPDAMAIYKAHSQDMMAHIRWQVPLTAEEQPVANALDTGMGTHGYGTLWRGVGPSKIADAQVGEVVTDPAFMATSPSQDQAAAWAKPDGALLKIERAYRIPGNSTLLTGPEPEMVLPRAVHLEVLERIDRGPGMAPVVRVRPLLDGDSKQDDGIGYVFKDGQWRQAGAATAAIPIDSTPPSPDTPPPQRETPTTLQDVGEKIGGARKDAWASRGMAVDDLDHMSHGEASKFVTKDAVWPKPDYGSLVEAGMFPQAAALVKIVRDRLAARPAKDTPDGRRDYVRMLGLVRTAFEAARTPEDVRDARRTVIYDQVGWPLNGGISNRPTPAQSALLFSIFKGRRESLAIDGADRRKAEAMVNSGFPTPPAHPWLKSVEVKEVPGYGTVIRRDGKFLKSGFEGEAAAHQWLQEQWEARYGKPGEEGIAAGPRLPDRPHLDRLERRGDDIRQGRDVTGADFLSDFGFRGIEFGNWVASDERQKLVNLAYDGLYDLARTLGISPKALSLDGHLGLAFGARGGGGALAHYEPAKLVINLTKIRGAGTLAHEFAHALDHYFGELGRADAYQGEPRGASGWYQRVQAYDGQPHPRFDRATGARIDEMRLPNIRPEMARAFDTVMAALFQRDRTAAEEVRVCELALERANAQVSILRENVANATGGKAGRVAEENLAMWQRIRATAEETLAAARGGVLQPGRRVNSSFYDSAVALSGKKGADGYWARPTEMFARAMESYVFDKIQAANGQSDYLVHGVEGARYAGEAYKGNPYPAGDERAAINAAFDTLFNTMEERIGTDGHTALFSRGTPLPRSGVAGPEASLQPIPIDALTPPPDHPEGRPWRYGSLTICPLAWDLLGVVSIRSANRMLAEDLAAEIAPLRDVISPQAAFGVYEALYDISGQIPEEVGGAVFSTTDNDGAVSRPMVAISVAAHDPSGTFSHEALHYLKLMGHLKNDEYATLQQHADQWSGQFSIRGLYPNAAGPAHIEESIATAFAAYFRAAGGSERPVGAGRDAESGHQSGGPAPLTPPSFPPDARDVFDRILSGEIGRRAPSPTVDLAAPSLATSFARDRSDRLTLDLFSTAAPPPPADPGPATAAAVPAPAQAPTPPPPDLTLADDATWQAAIWAAATARWDAGEDVYFGTSTRSTRITPDNRDALRFSGGAIEQYEGRRAGVERWFKMGTTGQPIDTLATGLGLPTSWARVSATADRAQAENAARFALHIQIAADSVAALRAADVHRVIDQIAPDDRAALAVWLREARPDMAGEIDTVMLDLDAATSDVTAAGIEFQLDHRLGDVARPGSGLAALTPASLTDTLAGLRDDGWTQADLHAVESYARSQRPDLADVQTPLSAGTAATATPAAGAPLNIAPLNARYVVVRDASRSHRERIEAAGGRWDPSANGFLVPIANRDTTIAALADLLPPATVEPPQSSPAPIAAATSPEPPPAAPAEIPAEVLPGTAAFRAGRDWWEGLPSADRRQALTAAGWTSPDGSLNSIGRNLLTSPWVALQARSRGSLMRKNGVELATSFAPEAPTPLPTSPPGPPAPTTTLPLFGTPGGEAATLPRDGAGSPDPLPPAAPLPAAEHRYGAFNRPAGHGTVPPGFLRVEPRPDQQADKEGWDVARHGVVTYGRALSDDEIRSFELVPFLTEDGRDALATAIAGAMAEHRDRYLELATRGADMVRERVWTEIRSRYRFGAHVGPIAEFTAQVMARLAADSDGAQQDNKLALPDEGPSPSAAEALPADLAADIDPASPTASTREEYRLLAGERASLRDAVQVLRATLGDRGAVATDEHRRLTAVNERIAEIEIAAGHARPSTARSFRHAYGVPADWTVRETYTGGERRPRDAYSPSGTWKLHIRIVDGAPQANVGYKQYVGAGDSYYQTRREGIPVADAIRHIQSREAPAISQSPGAATDILSDDAALLVGLPPGSHFINGKGALAADKWGVADAAGHLVWQLHDTKLDAATATRQHLVNMARVEERAEAANVAYAAIGSRLKAGEQLTDADIRTLGLKTPAGFQWLSPVAQRLFGISRAQVRESMGDALRSWTSDGGTVNWHADPRKALANAAAFAVALDAKTQAAPPTSSPPRPLAPNFTLPDAVRDSVAQALDTLRQYAEQLRLNRNADATFRGAGRYEAGTAAAWAARVTRADEVLAEFHRLAPGNGIDPDAVILALGGTVDVELSAQAADWLAHAATTAAPPPPPPEFWQMTFSEYSAWVDQTNAAGRARATADDHVEIAMLDAGTHPDWARLIAVRGQGGAAEAIGIRRQQIVDAIATRSAIGSEDAGLLRESHRRTVQRAIEAGLLVPPAVLADYSDLSAAAPAEAAPAVPAGLPLFDTRPAPAATVAPTTAPVPAPTAITPIAPLPTFTEAEQETNPHVRARVDLLARGAADGNAHIVAFDRAGRRHDATDGNARLVSIPAVLADQLSDPQENITVHYNRPNAGGPNGDDFEALTLLGLRRVVVHNEAEQFELELAPAFRDWCLDHSPSQRAEVATAIWSNILAPLRPVSKALVRDGQDEATVLRRASHTALAALSRAGLVQYTYTLPAAPLIDTLVLANVVRVAAIKEGLNVLRTDPDQLPPARGLHDAMAELARRHEIAAGPGQPLSSSSDGEGGSRDRTAAPGSLGIDGRDDGPLTLAPSSPPVSSDTAPSPQHPPPTPEAAAPASPPFTITSQADLAPAGQAAKVTANLAALRLLKEMESSGRPATPADRQVLARYSGWGHSPQIFDETKADWAERRAELASILTEPEFAAARLTTLNAHYTSHDVTSSIWRGVQDLGFTGGRVLEPGCGIGNFLGAMPPSLAGRTSTVGVELDPTTAAIAAHLYPEAEIRAEGFESTRLAPASFDLMIGNVPFGKIALHDPAHNRGGHSIHNHFILKSLDLAKPGAVLAVVTSRYTMDARNSSARRDMADHADLLGAIRLPETAFKANAGTDAVTDILFLRKRLPGEQPLDQSWIGTTAVPASSIGTPGGGAASAGGAPPPGSADSIHLNSYFTQHPEHILGSLAIESGMYNANTLTVKPNPGPLSDQIAAAAASIASAAREAGRAWSPVTSPATQDQQTGAPPARAPLATKEGAFYVDDDGAIRIRENGYGVDAKVPPADADEVKALIALRDTVHEILDIQSSAAASPDATPAADAPPLWAGAQEKLNQLYDDYVARYGAINRFTPINRGPDENGEERIGRRYPKMGGFRQDADYASVIALEVFDDEHQVATKAAVFSRRVLNAPRVIRGADDAQGALMAVLEATGRVDLPRMAELLATDQESVIAELKGAIYHNPTSGNWVTADEYLSGNVRGKLRAATAAAEADPAYVANVEALRKVQPRDLAPREIVARLGAPWIPAGDVQDFIREVLDTDEVHVDYAGLINAWSVNAPSKVARSPLSRTVWGTTRRDAITLLTDALTGRPTAVHDTTREGRQVKNPRATLDACEKREKLSEAFGTWLWQDPARAARLATSYNEQFNSTVLRSFDGSHLRLPGLSTAITPHDHQRNVAWRIVQDGNTLVAHTVGAGKTLASIIAAMEERRLGLVTKPAFAVPNHMLEQFAREFKQAYPAARLLLADKDAVSPESRKAFVAKCAMGDWDAVIFTHNSFAAIPVSAEAQAAFIQQELTDLEAAIRAAKEEDGGHTTIKELERAKKSRTERVKALLAPENKDDGITFEQTGIDRVYTDEIHLFKNLAFVTSRPGVSAPASQRATDLFLKTQILEEKTPGRSLVGLSGTPIANRVAEMYVMQLYFDRQGMADMGIAHFDAWASTFGQDVTAVELAPDGATFRLSTRFAKYNNVPELLTHFRSFADVQTADMLNLPVPAIKGGKPQVITIPATALQKAYIKSIQERMEAIRNREVEPREDNMLKVTSDGRKAAADMRLLGFPAEADGSKADIVGQNVGRIYRDTADYEYPVSTSGLMSPNRGALQLVFCDLGTPKADGSFSMYDAIRESAVANGVPANRIRYIHDYSTDTAKARLFADCRAGRVSVLLGSTEKMGVGTNVQDRLYAIHHVDCPWRPVDIKQRNGRKDRQGNIHFALEIATETLVYGTEGTFDVYMWQGAERKAAFIGQIMKGDLETREIEDIDGQALSYAEAKAILTGNPVLMEKAGIDAEVAKLQRMWRNHSNEQHSLRGTIETSHRIIAIHQREIETLREVEALIRLPAADAPAASSIPLSMPSFNPEAVIAHRPKHDAATAALEPLPTAASASPIGTPGGGAASAEGAPPVDADILDADVDPTAPKPHYAAVRAAAAKALLGAITSEWTQSRLTARGAHRTVIGQFAGLPLALETGGNLESDEVRIRIGEPDSRMTTVVDATKVAKARSAAPVVANLFRHVDDIPATIRSYTASIEEKTIAIAQAEAALGRPFEHQDALDMKLARQAEIDAQLAVDMPVVGLDDAGGATTSDDDADAGSAADAEPMADAANDDERTNFDPRDTRSYEAGFGKARTFFRGIAGGGIARFDAEPFCRELGRAANDGNRARALGLVHGVLSVGPQYVHQAVTELSKQTYGGRSDYRGRDQAREFVAAAAGTEGWGLSVTAPEAVTNEGWARWGTDFSQEMVVAAVVQPSLVEGTYELRPQMENLCNVEGFALGVLTATQRLPLSARADLSSPEIASAIIDRVAKEIDAMANAYAERAADYFREPYYSLPPATQRSIIDALPSDDLRQQFHAGRAALDRKHATIHSTSRYSTTPRSERPVIAEAGAGLLDTLRMAAAPAPEVALTNATVPGRADQAATSGDAVPAPPGDAALIAPRHPPVAAAPAALPDPTDMSRPARAARFAALIAAAAEPTSILQPLPFYQQAAAQLEDARAALHLEQRMGDEQAPLTAAMIEQLIDLKTTAAVHVLRSPDARAGAVAAGLLPEIMERASPPSDSGDADHHDDLACEAAD